MIIIEHRVNSIAQLERMPPEHGAEIDIRTFRDRLVLTHTPKQDAQSLEEWLGHYHHGPLVLNVKEDGLEDEILEMVGRYEIPDLFFLDLTIPAAVRLARRGERRFAVRYSEFEPLDFCLSFAGLAQWCWLDCFTRLPLDERTYSALKENFKLCLVSPELEGHDPNVLIPQFRHQLANFAIDAVCTDFPHLWNPKQPGA